MTQHAELSPERWSSFSLSQQVLMIGNEMNRAGKRMRDEDAILRREAYERVLNLTDLTIRVQRRRGLRRELLRWRDLVADLYLKPDAQPVAHRAAFRSLLQLTPEASRQIPYVAG